MAACRTRRGRYGNAKHQVIRHQAPRHRPDGYGSTQRDTSGPSVASPSLGSQRPSRHAAYRIAQPNDSAEAMLPVACADWFSVASLVALSETPRRFPVEALRLEAAAYVSRLLHATPHQGSSGCVRAPGAYVGLPTHLAGVLAALFTATNTMLPPCHGASSFLRIVTRLVSRGVATMGHPLRPPGNKPRRERTEIRLRIDLLQ